MKLKMPIFRGLKMQKTAIFEIKVYFKKTTLHGNPRKYALSLTYVAIT